MNSIANIQKELDETKIVLHKTIESVGHLAHQPPLPLSPRALTLLSCLGLDIRTLTSWPMFIPPKQLQVRAED